MFTGLVEGCVPIRRRAARQAGARMWIPAPEPDWRVSPGQSVAVSGTCLSVVCGADPSSGAERPLGVAGVDMVFDLSAETLARTWFSTAEAGTWVNLERALRLGDRLDGHLVAGHVDGVAELTAIADLHDGGRQVTFEVASSLAHYLVDKGSITLDGVSLTVVAPRGARFEVALIPLTLARTSLGRARVGTRVHVEVDMIGKWIERLVAAR